MHLRISTSPAVRGIVILLMASAFASAANAQVVSADLEADKLLQSAEEAHAKKDYPLATSRFRDVLTRFPKTASAPAAKFGLAVCLINGHDKNNAEDRKSVV